MNRRYIPFFGITAAVVALDQLSKALVRSSIPSGHGVWLIKPILSFTHVSNTGAAFSILPGANTILMVVSIAALTFIGYSLRKIPRPQLIFLGLITGGIIGNLIDRILHGAVTDFIDFQIWPVFNVADSCLCIGITVLVLDSLLRGEAKKEKRRQ